MTAEDIAERIALEAYNAVSVKFEKCAYGDAFKALRAIIAAELRPLVEAQRKHEWLIAQWKAEEIMWHDQEDADAKEIASLKKELKELKTREQLWRDYNDFLREADAGAHIMAYLHGWEASEWEIRTGKEYREKLGILTDKDKKDEETN